MVHTIYIYNIYNTNIYIYNKDLSDLPKEIRETLKGNHSLLAAAAVGNVQVVSEYIGKGANLGARNLRGQTAMLVACLSAFHDQDEEDNEDNEDNEDEDAPRTKEMRKLQAEEVAALLIEPTRAADALDAVDDNGMSSLIAARNNGLDDIVKMLLKLGAKPDLTEKKGSTEDEEEEK